MFFTAPVPMSPYTLGYYPRYRPGVTLAASACAAQYLAEQCERAWALCYQRQPVNQPTPIALLAQEYDEFLDRQRMMRLLRSTCRPQGEEKDRYIMALERVKMQRILQRQYFVSVQADIEEEQAFARHREDAEKFLAEAETYLSEFLPPDEESYLTLDPLNTPVCSNSSSHSASCDSPHFPTFSPQVPSSTSEVIIQDEPQDVIDDCVMTENRLMAKYRFEVFDTLQSILGSLSAVIEAPIEHVPKPPTVPETSSMQVNDNEEGASSQE